MSDENQFENSGLSEEMENRINLGVALRSYLRAVERFEAASTAFNQSCVDVRKSLGANKKFVAYVDYKHYLISSDDHGNFEVEPVESL